MGKSAKTKTRAANVAVPQNRIEAQNFLRMIGDAARERAAIENAMNKRIAGIKEKAEEEATLVDVRINALTEGLRIYCEANRDTLTDGGKTKTVDLGTGKVSWRKQPAKVTIRKVEDVLQKLKEMALQKFIRTKEEVNKEAMLLEPDLARTVPGVTIGSEGEDFSAEPFEVTLEGEKAA